WTPFPPLPVIVGPKKATEALPRRVMPSPRLPLIVPPRSCTVLTPTRRPTALLRKLEFKCAAFISYSSCGHQKSKNWRTSNAGAEAAYVCFPLCENLAENRWRHLPGLRRARLDAGFRLQQIAYLRINGDACCCDRTDNVCDRVSCNVVRVHRKGSGVVQSVWTQGDLFQQTNRASGIPDSAWCVGGVVREPREMIQLVFGLACLFPNFHADIPILRGP